MCYVASGLRGSEAACRGFARDFWDSAVTSLELPVLDESVDRDAAIRCRFVLEPAGGPGDKVKPPTYGDGRYAAEVRRINGDDVPCVVLDSVASQANRMEASLLSMIRDGSIALPLVSVSFAAADGSPPLEVNSLSAPHRIYDAIFRDSLLGDVPFPKSEMGSRIIAAWPDDATALFASCPTTLVFGGWHSTGPRGGNGHRFPRVLVSEVVGMHARQGVTTRSRLDPLQIGSGVPVYACSKPPGWTIDPEQATKVRGKAVLFPSGAPQDRAGRASFLNHSSVTPSIEEHGGGVSIDKAEQTSVLSLAGLRQLRFPVDGTEDAVRSRTARVVLALLSMVAVSGMQRELGMLRSRCMLCPAEPPVWEILDAMGGPPRSFNVDLESLSSMLADAIARARDLGMPWHADLVELTPSTELMALVSESRRRELDRFGTVGVEEVE